jgi:hypothetical protein
LAGIMYAVLLGRLMEVPAMSWFGFVSPAPTAIPFVHSAFPVPFSLITMGLAALMAVLQVGAEIWGDAWLFWLHRPMSRRTLIGSKLSVGLMATLTCSALPILLYGWWCSLPNRVAAPFEWGMTGETWRAWWSASAVYLGTFLSMLRPGRWWATRCLPAAAVLWSWASVSGIASGMTTCIFDVVFLACIVFVAKDREYP